MRRNVVWPSDSSDQVQLVCDPQRTVWRGNRGDWAVLFLDNEWSVIAKDREGVRRARETLTAFLGPRLGRLAGEVVPIDLEVDGDVHPAMQVALGVDVPMPSLEQLASVRSGAPVTSIERDPTLPRLLRDFRLALMEGAVGQAERALKALRAQALLSAENFTFLQIEMLGSLGRWAELRGLEWFNQTATAARPRRVTELMLESIWWVELSDCTDATSAFEKFKVLETDVSPLTDAVDVPRTWNARRVVALRSFEQGSSDRLDRLKAASTEDQRSWIDALLKPADPTTELPPSERARQMFDEGRFADVVHFAVQHATDERIVEFAVRAVAETEDPSLAGPVFPLVGTDILDRCPKTPGFERCLVVLRRLVGNGCSTWSAWLERVAGDESWPDAEDVCRASSENWPWDEFDDRVAVGRMAAALDRSRTGPNEHAVERCIDLLCQLAGTVATKPTADEFVTAVLLTLLDWVPSPAVGNAFVGLVHAVLDAGPTRERYGDLIDVCLVSGQVFDKRQLLPMALDVLDELAMYPSPDVEKRTALAVTAGEGFRRLKRLGYLGDDPAAQAELLLAELGVPVPLRTSVEGAESEPSTTKWELLTGRYVALYTLQGNVALRFQDRLRSFNPNVGRFEHFDDHVGSDRLENAARNADYFIVHTQRAKHAATGAIDNLRPKSRQLLPDGRGVSSLVTCLSEALDAEAAG